MAGGVGDSRVRPDPRPFPSLRRWAAVVVFKSRVMTLIRLSSD